MLKPCVPLTIAVMLASGLSHSVAADLVFEAKRLPNNPIISEQLFVEAGIPKDGANINGPSLIRVPDWIPPAERADPTARYYLYFADHGGTYIRLAWAADIGGPYQLYKPGEGVLTLDRPGAVRLPDPGERWAIEINDEMGFGHHIASPDVHVDDENKRIVMFFHGYETAPEEKAKKKGNKFTAKDGTQWFRGAQKTFVATAPDGLDFNGRVLPKIVGGSYFRIFRAQDNWYASAYHGLHIAEDPNDILSDFNSIPYGAIDIFRARHTAVRVGPEDEVTIFFSRKKGEPEHIEYATVDRLPTSTDGRWSTHRARTLLKPEYEWEGAHLPIQQSKSGDADEPLHELRDPAYFRDIDGREYILYSVAGENGIGIAELQVQSAEGGSMSAAK